MVLSEFPFAHVRKVPFDRGCRSHHRADEMRASATTLPPFEVSITRRRATLTRLQDVGVHPQTHRTSRFAPFKSRLVKDAVESFTLRRLLHLLRSWYNHRAHRRVDPITLHHTRRRTQIFNTRIRARTDECPVDRDVLNVGARF